MPVLTSHFDRHTIIYVVSIKPFSTSRGDGFAHPFALTIQDGTNFGFRNAARDAVWISTPTSLQYIVDGGRPGVPNGTANLDFVTDPETPTEKLTTAKITNLNQSPVLSV
jgi:hypothetical protein